MNELKVVLPPYGFIIRDLMVSGLYTLAVNSLGDVDLAGDYMVIKYPSEYALINGVESVTKRLSSSNNVNIDKLLNRFSKNYGSQLKTLRDLLNDIQYVVRELKEYSKACSSSMDVITGCGMSSVINQFPLLLPESIESIRWYGGWSGNRKIMPKVILPTIVGYLALIGLSYFTLSSAQNLLLIAPIDSTIKMSSLFWAKSMKTPWLISVNQRQIKIVELPHLTRLFLLSLVLNGDRYHRVIVLSIGKRVEIIEDNPQSSISYLMSFASNLSSDTALKIMLLMSEWFINELRNELGDREQAISDVKYVLTQISDNVYKALSGVLSPEEAVYMIARETYMRHPTYGKVINDHLLKELRVSIRATLLG
ncbi:hypothetical protein [Caldivirga sp.]|uniref:hypothetical protein n=1 Tax=Caldivirga sp. TaxID=2080243 RepID=UPI003D0C11C2